MNPYVTRTPSVAEQNISRIARLETEFLEKRTFAERVGDRIADFMGSIWFVVIHVIWFALWILLNGSFIPVRHFDPYPFLLLGQILSMEAVLLSTFVLTKQNRMSRRADQREHLSLQINLLAEQEVTKLLQLTRLLCERHGIAQATRDEKVKELAKDTAIEDLAEALQKELPD
jgi:uncharacterized membrane protein